MKLHQIHFISALFLFSFASPLSAKVAIAAPKANPAARANSKTGPSFLLPENLGAKAFLEDLMVRRYTQKLATRLDRQTFTLGAQLELVEAPKPEFKNTNEALDDRPTDLLLGTLDPEDLIRKFPGADSAAIAQGFLDNYRVRSINISVGLQEDLSAETKAEIEKWLAEQMKSEFGEAGKSSVSTIRTAEKKPTAPKNFWDWLSQFQSLAGQIVLGLAILFGAILWRMIPSHQRTSGSAEVDSKGGASVSAGGGASASASGPAGLGGGLGGHNDPGKSDNLSMAKQAQEESERTRHAKEVKRLTKDIVTLMPKVTQDFERVLRSWTQAGEEGRLKLACFAEAVGRDIGKLPIPADAVSELSKIFVKMPSLGIQEKRDTLQKAYWDILAVINLGPETLEQPFDYLGTLNVGLVNQILMNQNSKLKTLVTLHMPNELRDRYLEALSPEGKREMVESALKFQEVPLDELRALDLAFKSKLSPEGKKNIVPLRAYMAKLLDALTPIDQISILSSLSGELAEELKRTMPTLAFLKLWPDEKLSSLLSSTMPDEILSYLRVNPDQKDRFMSLCPPMTAEMVNDEFAAADKMSDKDKNRNLAVFTNRLKDRVKRKELDLEEIFKSKPQDQEAQGAPSEIKKAA